LTAREDFCRSAVLLLHSRTAVRLPNRKAVLMSQLTCFTPRHAPSCNNMSHSRRLAADQIGLGALFSSS
jgi:hypothetical protein